MHAIVVIACLLGQAPDANTAAQVRSLVRELDAPQKAARDDAERQLVALGAAALPHLPNLKQNDSAELAQRLDRVRRTLLNEKAKANLKGSQVTLHAADTPLADVLADVERQTGNKLVDYRRSFGQQADDIRLTLDLRDAPFWQSLDRLTAAAGLQPYHFANEDGLALVSRTGNAAEDSAKLPTHDVGAFRTQIRSIATTRSFDASQTELQLDLEVAWEPRLRPMFFTATMAKMKLVDDAGRELPASNPELVLEIPPQGRASKIDAKLTFAAPPRSAAKLRSFSGEIAVLLPADQHTFRFGNLAEAKRQEQRAAAATVVLERTRSAENFLEITLRLQYEHPANALESHRAWFYKNPAFLEAADGARTPPGTVELIRQANDELVLKLIFPTSGDVSGQTFTYQTPADLVSLPIAFEFSDLPLP